MVDNNTPNQKFEVLKENKFTQNWYLWFQNIYERIKTLEGLVGVSSETAFGEAVSARNVPFVQGTAIYNLIPANFREFTFGTGTTAAENRLFKASTGTGVGGYGAIQSFRSIPSKSGISNMMRFTGYFETSAADSWQGIGLINIGDELSFGYDGTSFGIWHRYGGLAECRTMQVTGGAGGATDLTLTLDGVAYTIPLTAGSVQHNAYEISAWLNSNQSVWTTDQLDDSVIISALSDGSKAGAYSFSHATATGTITQNTSGVTKNSNHIPQSSWNQNRMSGLDTSKGNVYQIVFQNMGFGEAKFYIEDENTSKFVLVHALRVANTTNTTVLSNPSMSLGMYCVSLGSTTNLSVYVDSFSGFLQGEGQKTRNPRAYSSTQSITTTNETVVLALRNRKTYNNLVNQIEIEPLIATIANETNKNAKIRIRATQSTGVEQDFQTIGSNLVADVSTTPVTFSGGRLLAASSVAPSGEVTIDLQKLAIQQPPSLMLLVTVERAGTTGTNTNFTGTITWYEDL